MDEILKNLKKQGWNLSAEKLNDVFEDEEDGASEKKQFFNNAEKWLLNEDIKTIGSPILPEGINSGKISQLACPIVLQVKMVNIISAPQNNTESQTAPRMLKIAFSDGKTICHGIELEHIPRLSMKTPPGTKVRLTNSVRCTHGFLLLDNKNVQILGGEVPHLMDEWRIQQSLIGYIRVANLESGPPPWVPFGQKVQADHIIESKTEKEPVEEIDDKDEEFLNQRQDAIAAAVHTGQKKVFKGSGKQMEIQQPERRGRGRGEGGGRRGRERMSREEMAASRPRDSISLFEFLPTAIGAEGAQQQQQIADDYVDSEEDEEPSQRYDHGRGRGHPSRSGHGSFDDRGGSYGYREESWNEDRRDSSASYGRGRGRPFNDRSQSGSYRDRDDRGGSYRGRGDRGSSYRGRDDRGGSYRGQDDRGGSYRGRDDRGNSYRGRDDGEDSYRGRDDRGGSYRGRDDRGGSYRGQGDRGDSYRGREDRRGSHRGRGDRGSSYRGREDREGSYRGRGGFNRNRDDRSYFDDGSQHSRNPIETLVDDFTAWPGLGDSQEPDPPPRAHPVSGHQPSKWKVDDYCLAKWDANKDFPAIIQDISANGLSATVVFVETGAFRTVDIRSLKHDPGDAPSVPRTSYSSQSTRVYTRRPGRSRF